MPLQIGQAVPDFNLRSSKMEDVSLSAQRGKSVLLLFIPLAFTPT
jgi:peroxiredoxin